MTQKLTAIFGIAVLSAILLGGLTFSQSALANGGGGQVKVTLCHVDQETGEEITITVGAPAVPAHLAHGDILGPCDEEPEPTTCEECSIASSDALILCDGELNCMISAQQEFAECTLTCEGDHNGIPEACFNSLSGGFSNCLDFATTPDELETCEQEYVEQQIDCAANIPP